MMRGYAQRHGIDFFISLHCPYQQTSLCRRPSGISFGAPHIERLSACRGIPSRKRAAGRGDPE